MRADDIGSTRVLSALARIGLLCLCLGLSACRCGGGVSGTPAQFNASPSAVDFGRVLLGTQDQRMVTLTSAAPADLQVDVTTQGAAFSGPASVVVPGGGRASVVVVFTAGDGGADGTVTLSAHTEAVAISLHGFGVVPLACHGPDPCHVSVFNVDSGTCVVTPSGDGASCVPTSPCLDHATCHAGDCVGSPRSCDDGNACTTDTCSEAIGCVHTSVTCPPPTALCLVATCDPASGCGTGAAPDGTVCGALDCVTANLCLAGGCVTLPTPDGTRCALPTPCRGPGTCESHVCVVPDAGDMTPAYAAPLDLPPSNVSDPAPTVLAYAGDLFWEACDGGCWLAAYTENGFLKFEVPSPDPRPRALVALSGTGALVLAPDAVESYSTVDGGLLWRAPLSQLAPPPAGFNATTAPGRIAGQADGGWTVALGWVAGPDAGVDAGSRFPLETVVSVGPEGGTLLGTLDAGTQSLLAYGLGGTLYGYDPAGPLWSGFLTRGAFPGQASLAVAGGALTAGAAWWVALDGGTGMLPAFESSALEPLPHAVLMASGISYSVFATCAPPFSDPCAEVDKTQFVRAVDATSGLELWEAPFAAPGVATALVEAAVAVAGPFTGVATVSQTVLDAGDVEAHAQLFVDGGELFRCRLPPPSPLGGAAFADGFVFVQVQRDAGWTLEAYDLKGLPLSLSGWPLRNGVGGARRELP